MLRLATIPDDVLASETYRSTRLFMRQAREAGFEPFRVPMPIDWNWARRELRGEMEPAYTSGDVIYGVNNGGKHTVDVTYVAAAEATGNVEVAVLHQVRDIERDAAGRWVVHVDRIDTGGEVLERKRIITDALFMAAGSPGTTRLMMKAQAKDLVSGLPDELGKRWGNNGDRIHAWSPAGESPGDRQGGPACVGVQDWDDREGPVTVVQGPVPFPQDFRISSLDGYGVAPPLGEFRYAPDRDDAILHWNQSYDGNLTRAIRARVDKIAGDAPGATVLDATSLDPTTFHPLGGAVIGSARSSEKRAAGTREPGHRADAGVSGSAMPPPFPQFDAARER